MHPHKLKIHVTSTLFCLLVVAMILINMVIVIFWYQHMIQQKIFHIKSVINIWAAEHSAEKVNWDDMEGALQLLHDQLGHDCQQIVMANSAEAVMTIGSSTTTGLEQMVRSAFLNGSKTVSIKENLNIPLFLMPKLLSTVYKPDLQNLKSIAVGTLVDISDIYSQLWQKEKYILFYLILNAFILTIVGFFRMRKIFFEPIEKLVTVTETYQIAEGGGLFLNHSENEFGHLSKAMSAMVLRMEEDRRKLFETVGSLKEVNKQSFMLKNSQRQVAFQRVLHMRSAIR